MYINTSSNSHYRSDECIFLQVPLRPCTFAPTAKILESRLSIQCAYEI